MRKEWFRPLLALVLAMVFSSPSEAVYTLPPERAVSWQGNVGVNNDLPERTTIHAILSPSRGDDSSAIQNAINSCPRGKVVQLKAGTFAISRPVTVKSGITLRGAGMGATVIKGMQGMGGTFLIGIYDSAFHEGVPFGIVGGLKKGSRTITTSAPHGWKAGDIVIVDQLNDSRGNPPVTNKGASGTSRWDGRTEDRSLGQVNRVTAVTGRSATLEIPLYWDFDPSLAPKGTRLGNVVTGAGIEDLTVDNSASGSRNQMNNGGTVVTRGTAECWLLRVEVIGSWQSGVRVNGTYRNTFRSCKVHEGVPALPSDGPQYGPSRAYGFFVNPYSSADLFEDNEIYHLVTPFMIHGAVSGNVIAYNYLPDPYYSDSNWIQVTIEFHGAHPMMNLIEGNYSIGRISPDNYWGSSSHNTFFRNRSRLPPGKTGATWNFDLQYHARYYNIIGNVIGTPGEEQVYQLRDVDLKGHWAGKKAIFRFGYRSDGDATAAENDPEVHGTVLRHGNWDSVNGVAVWNGTDERTLPASLYLSGRPPWWRKGPWPPIGPDLTPKFPADPGAGAGMPW